jgi:hypothetical protein
MIRLIIAGATFVIAPTAFYYRDKIHDYFYTPAKPPLPNVIRPWATEVAPNDRLTRSSSQ